jgi:lipopolysaccharide export system permease protein
MKTLHLYLTRQTLATLLLTVAVFTFILLLGNVLKEILSLIVNRQADLPILAKAIGLLIPYVLVFALPMGLLTATLLVFGRFSADQELTAARASGLSLISMITPVLFISVLLSVFSAMINLEWGPRCRVMYKDLLVEHGMKRPAGLLQENQYVQDPSGGLTIYVGKISGTNLSKVELFQSEKDKNSQKWFKAESGTFTTDPETREIILTLFQPYGAYWEEGAVRPAGDLGDMILRIPTHVDRSEPSLSDMTFWQLRAKLMQLEERFFHYEPRRNLKPEQLRAERDRLAQMKSDLTLPIQVQIHREIAFSFACVGFALVGIPLGIRAHRRETTAGIAMALILVLVYYSFIILGQALETRPEFAPHLIVWLPNFVFQAVGAVLLWRANRGI